MTAVASTPTPTASHWPPDTAAVHEALVAGARPRPQGPFAASATFGWRTLLRIKHVP